jgi:hypothetical protein
MKEGEGIMKKLIRALMILTALMFAACTYNPSSSDIQRDKQEQNLKEAVSEVGTPNIKNYREMRALKDIQELCDQEGFTTYTYLENMIPTVVPGHTALGGKLTFMMESIGYGIPYATQFTAPESMQRYTIPGDAHHTIAYGIEKLPQADPNGLFKPASADGTWVLVTDPVKKRAVPIFVEPRIVSLPFKLPMD